MGALLALRDATREYRMGEVTVQALRGIDLDIDAGQVVVLLGPSGSGKTTLLNLAGGLDTPTRGQVWVAGEAIGGYDARRLADGPVIGIHMVGARVGELVGEAQLIYNWEAFPSEVAQLIHAHPTQTEALGEAHLALAGKPLHAHG